MDIAPINSALAQAVSAARSPQAAGAAKPGGFDFVDSLESALKAVSQQQVASTGAQRAFQSGDPTVSLEETMVAMSKASISFQATVQVRNKLVQAYESVMNMPV
ncbi:MAG: flagellar hook-basal body complex protein FliE [Burkholderiaceae bacterium]